MGIGDPVTIIPIIIASTPQCIDNEWRSELSIAMIFNKFSLEMFPCIVSAAIAIMLSTCN